MLNSSETLAELGYELHEYEESLLRTRRLTEVQKRDIRARSFRSIAFAGWIRSKKRDTLLILRKLDPYNEIVLVWLPKK